MNHSGNRGASAVGDIGHGAGNCTGHRDSAEERHCHVGDTLSDKLGVVAGVVTGGTIGNGSRK